MVGKRARVKTDGTNICKILLSEDDRKKAEGRTEAMSHVYNALTNKILAFEFVKPQIEDKKGKKKKSFKNPFGNLERWRWKTILI